MLLLPVVYRLQEGQEGIILAFNPALESEPGRSLGCNVNDDEQQVRAAAHSCLPVAR